MPEEVLVVTIVAIVVGCTSLVLMARMLFKYLNARTDRVPRVESPSLTTSELEHMLRKVAFESNEPLLARIEELEEKLAGSSARSLPAAGRPLLELEGPEVQKAASPRQKPSSRAVL